MLCNGGKCQIYYIGVLDGGDQGFMCEFRRASGDTSAAAPKSHVRARRCEPVGRDLSAAQPIL